MGFQRLKVWDLDLVLLADGEKMRPAIFRMEGADEDSGARQNLQGFQGGRDSCAGGVGARSAMAGRRRDGGAAARAQ